MELESKVETAFIDLQCKKCKKGIMIATGQLSSIKMGAANLPNWLHRCNNKECNHSEWIRGKKYPMLMYRRTDEVKPYMGLKNEKNKKASQNKKT